MFAAKSPLTFNVTVGKTSMQNQDPTGSGDYVSNQIHTQSGYPAGSSGSLMQTTL